MEPIDRERGLRRTDWLLLVLFCTLLYGYLLVDTRVLTTHETVHCQNVREMLRDHDWIIPHYGGRPWLERPPLPHWITAAVVRLTGVEHEWGYRLSTALVALVIVLTVASTAARCIDRTIGLLSGLILASMQEFEHYATGPEADMFLCLLVTAALCLFARLEFSSDPTDSEDRGFLGRRSWKVLAFFVLLGLTNVAKGLFFGSTFIVLAVASYLVGNWDWKALRRYVWLWGWLACLLVASSWAFLAHRRFPDIVDLWKSDYLGRLNQGYMREPAYYYLLALPLVLLPWLLPALAGLVGPAGQRLPCRGTPERFLCCWALVPIAFFSLSQGKHHHYLLQCVAPWAVLAAMGTVRGWRWFLQTPSWLRHPATSFVLLAVPLGLSCVLFRHKLPGPLWVLPALLAVGPVILAVGWWAVGKDNPRLALGTFLGLYLLCHHLQAAYQTRFMNVYRQDLDFVARTRHQAEGEPQTPLFVIADFHPLNASWMLFYLGERAGLLHNSTFLSTDRVRTPEVLLVARADEEARLREYGTTTVLSQSRHSRYESIPGERWTLFRLHFRNDAPHYSAQVYISPMQATGRASGPYVH
jgi:4-amino-4-deoxy-L-arabinose transferase-like glycosyltransferase